MSESLVSAEQDRLEGLAERGSLSACGRSAAMTQTIAALPLADLDAAVLRARPALSDLRDASLFITGGTGFFGRWLLAILSRAQTLGEWRGAATVLSRAPEAFLEAWPDFAGQPWLRFHSGDIRAFEFPKGRFSHIIHAATDTSAAADARPQQLSATIVDGTRRVLDFAAQAKARRLLYVSSGAVYGAQPPTLDRLPEDFRGAPDPLDPRATYGLAKKFAEHLCCVGGQAGGFETIVARAFAFVGSGLPLDGHFAIGNFIADARAGKTIAVKGDGTPLRSYLYAGDLAVWLFTMLARGQNGSAYNVGSDKALSIADLAAKVALVLKAPGVRIAGTVEAAPKRSLYIPDIDKARAELGLDVWTSLDEAIRRTSHGLPTPGGDGP